MGLDLHGQELAVGDEVIIRAKIEEMPGDVVHLRSVVPTQAYPEGTRINMLCGQVEKLTQDDTDKVPLNGDGSEPDASDTPGASSADEPKEDKKNGRKKGK